MLNQDATGCNCPAAARAETQHRFLLCALKHISICYICISLSHTNTHIYVDIYAHLNVCFLLP